VNKKDVLRKFIAEKALKSTKQREIIEEHGRDPLKGLIITPEEKHTFLGRGAIEKGKRPEEWEKEEFHFL